MTPASSREGDSSNGGHRVFEVGLLLLIVSLPLAGMMIRTLSGTTQTQWLFIPLPDVNQTFTFVPPLEAGEFDVGEWLRGVLADFLELVFAVTYYLVLSAVIFGLTLLVGGSIGLSDPTELWKSIRRAIGRKPVQVLLSIYAMAGLAIAFPERSRIALEIGLMAFLWFGMMLTLLAIWSYTELTDHPFPRIVIWYPLTVAIVGLPSVVVGMVSPTLKPGFVTVTETLLALVFPSELLPEITTVSIGGPAISPIFLYGMFWVGIVFGLGWFLGAITELVGWLPARIVWVSAMVWKRFVRIIRWLFRR